MSQSTMHIAAVGLGRSYFPSLPFTIGCIAGPNPILHLDPDIASQFSDLPRFPDSSSITHLRHPA